MVARKPSRKGKDYHECPGQAMAQVQDVPPSLGNHSVCVLVVRSQVRPMELGNRAELKSTCIYKEDKRNSGTRTRL